MAYTHLDYAERYSIWSLKRAGCSLHQVARILGRSPSTISRELSRNSGGHSYRARQAQCLADERRFTPAVWKFTGDLVRQVENLLRQQWSPEQISGWLKLQGMPSVSHERIYRHVYEDAHNGGDLWKNLRRIRRRRRRRGPGPGRHTKLRGHRLIDARPRVVDQRSRFGDWEGDTMVGKGHNGYLVTLLERRSRLLLAAKCPSRHSADVNRVIIDLLGGFPPEMKRTLTLDNGTEFVRHRELERITGAEIYFAHPYSAWERGANENANGLLRQYLPKATRFDELEPELLNRAVARLNGRPRKTLGFIAPAEFLLNSAEKSSEEQCLPASLRSALGPVGRPFGDGLLYATPEPPGRTSEASSSGKNQRKQEKTKTSVLHL